MTASAQAEPKMRSFETEDLRTNLVATDNVRALNHNCAAAIAIQVSDLFGYIKQPGLASVVRFSCVLCLWIMPALLMIASALMWYKEQHLFGKTLMPLAGSLFFLLGGACQVGSFVSMSSTLKLAIMPDLGERRGHLPNIRIHVLVGAVLWLCNTVGAISAAIRMLQTSGNIEYGTFGPLFTHRHPWSVLLWVLSAIITPIGHAAALALVASLPCIISEDLREVRVALDEEGCMGINRARYVYGNCIERMVGIRAVYKSIASIWICYGVIIPSVTLSNEIHLLSKSGDEALFRRQLSEQSRMWTVFALVMMLQVTLGATRIPARHSKLMLHVSRMTCQDYPSELRALATSMSLNRENFGMKIFGRIVTLRLLVTAISFLTTLIGLVRGVN